VLNGFVLYGTYGFLYFNLYRDKTILQAFKEKKKMSLFVLFYGVEKKSYDLG